MRNCYNCKFVNDCDKKSYTREVCEKYVSDMEDTAKYEVDMAEFDENEPADEKNIDICSSVYRSLKNKQTVCFLSLRTDEREYRSLKKH